MKNTFLTVVLAIFGITCSIAQWAKINAIPTQEMVAFATYGDTILAASGTNLLYKSVDGGSNWSTIIVSTDPIEINTLKIIDKNIYIGTYNHGIFHSMDNGLNWINSGANLLPVSGFEKKGNNLYLSTEGSGIHFFDQIGNNWIPFNNALPNYSFNVQSIIRTSNDLLIGAGGNGTFYRYDFNNNQWDEHYYYSTLQPGLQINKIINQYDTLLAVNGNKIIRSNNGGINWIDDKTGTHNGYTRNIYCGTANFYTVTNILTGGTWIQERNRNTAIGTSWAPNEEFLPTGYTYDILEYQNKLFLAKDDGLYHKNIISGIYESDDSDGIVQIFPNPSNGNEINISLNSRVNEIVVTSNSGQMLYYERINKNKFTIQPNLIKGIYFINLHLNNEIITKKIIID